MADFSAFYWSRHIFAGDRHWMDREAAVALKKLKMVSMPSRAYTSFLQGRIKQMSEPKTKVSMPSRAYTSFLQGRIKQMSEPKTKVSMPSRAYTSFLRYPLQKSRFYAVFRACFCRYLSEYSDNSSFSCMLTFWTYLMRCT